jgi:hypothetical protein
MILFFRRHGEHGLATVKIFADNADQLLEYVLEHDLEFFPVPGPEMEVVDLRKTKGATK